MHTMTIEVHGKADPEKGKKRGRVKDASGMIFQADPAILASMVVGSKYDIEYSDEEFKDFKYRVISEVKEVDKGSMTSVAPPRPSAAQAQYAEGQRAGAIPQPNYKDEEIGCYAILKCVKPMDGDSEVIFRNMKAAALGLRRFKTWQRSAASDMDDEIPYDK